MKNNRNLWTKVVRWGAFVLTGAKFISEEELQAKLHNQHQDLQRYYQKVIDQLHVNGTLPPNIDLKIPKKRLALFNLDTGDTVAFGGTWKRLPDDGEVVKAVYQSEK